MGEIINNTEKCYQNYEGNRSTPHFKTLIILADYFDVSLDYLVGRSDDDTPPTKEKTKEVKKIK